MPLSFGKSSLIINLAQGMTKLLLTKIPMFREVVISSFSCPHCGEKNSDIQSGARIQDKGIIFTLAVIEPSVSLVGKFSWYGGVYATCHG